jgi:hypothetical protein
MFDQTDSLIVMKDAVSYGSALVANRDFVEGEVIALFDDAPLAEQSYLTVQVGPGQHVELDVLSHLNHSCDPNTVIDTCARTVVAARDIKGGEVLSFFYPSTEWEMDRPFVCECGARDCIKIVAGARHLSVDTLSRVPVNLHILRAINTTLQSPTLRRQVRGRSALRPAAWTGMPVPAAQDVVSTAIPMRAPEFKAAAWCGAVAACVRRRPWIVPFTPFAPPVVAGGVFLGRPPRLFGGLGGGDACSRRRARRAPASGPARHRVAPAMLNAAPRSAPSPSLA